MDPLSMASSVAELIDVAGRLSRVMRDTPNFLNSSSFTAKVQNLYSLLHAFDFDDERIPQLFCEPVSIAESLGPVLRECKSTLEKVQRALETPKKMGKRGQLITRTLIQSVERDLSGQLQQLQLFYQLTSLRSALQSVPTEYRREHAGNRDDLATNRWLIHFSDPVEDWRRLPCNQGLESQEANEGTVNPSNDTVGNGDRQQLEASSTASTARCDAKMIPQEDSILEMQEPASKQRDTGAVPQLASAASILAAVTSRSKQCDLCSPRSDVGDPEGGLWSLSEKYVGKLGPHPVSTNTSACFGSPLSELGLDRHACQEKRRWDMAVMAAASAGATVMGLCDTLFRQEVGVGIDGNPLNTSIQAPDFVYTNLAVASTVIHPAVLIIGILANTTALTIYYHLHRGEKYQDVLLIAIVGTGAALGFFLTDLDASAILLRVTPWLGILALLWSTYGPGMIKQGRYNVRNQT